MKQYLDLLKDVKDNGFQKGDRTGTGTVSVFGRQTSFDLSKGFPLMTTKKIFIPAVVHELLWFIKGDTNTKYLTENGVRIWNEWADDNGNLGPVYGHQWRHWEKVKVKYDDVDSVDHLNGSVTAFKVKAQLESIDQLAVAIEQIKNNPNSRRIIINAWNVSDLPDESISPQENVEKGKMALAPCHAFIQFYVLNGKLSCQLYQRSADIFLGVPFNIASYALLTHMIAHVCDLEVGEFVHTFGDLHIYNNHFKQVDEQLSREPLELPKLVIKRKVTNIDDFTYDDFEFADYNPMGAIKAKVSI